MVRHILLIKIKNNKGPNIVPCGTPEVTFDHSEYALFTKTLYFLLFKKFVTQLSTLPKMPKF